MALMALDGPGNNERVYDTKFIGYLGAAPIGEFDFGGVTTKELLNSGRSSVAAIKSTKANPTQNLQALISHIDTELVNPNSKGFNMTAMTNAEKELTQWYNHDAANPSQQAQISHVLDLIDTFKTEAVKQGAAIGFSTVPGIPAALPSNPKIAITPISAFVYKGIDNVLSYPRVVWFFVSPMGVFQSNTSRALSTETQDTDTADLADIFNQMFGNINAWLTTNKFAGSGNVQSASEQTGENNFSLAANVSDGYGGYMNGLNTYGNYLNVITNPSFQVTNPKKTFLQQAASDVSAAAKAVTHVVQQVAKVAVAVVKEVEHVVAMVAAAPARLAALAAIRSNFENIATALATAWKKDSGKVSNTWSELGGSPADLKSAIITGSGVSLSGSRIGAGGKPTALQVVAVPVMKALFAMLAAMGIPVPTALQTAIENAVGGALNKANPPAGVTIKSLAVPTTNGAPAAAGFVPESTIPWVPIVLGIAALGLGFLIVKNKKR